MREYLKHKNWYSKTRYLLIKKYGKDYKIFVALLSATSPKSHIKKNFNLASSIYADYVKDKEGLRLYFRKYKAYAIRKYKLIPCHYNNILRALEHDFKKPFELSGQKVNSFYQNLTGNYHAVTIDIWILKYFKHGKAYVNGSEYKYYSRIIRKLAKHLNLLPAQAQAVLWEYTRGQYNISPKSFASFI